MRLSLFYTIKFSQTNFMCQNLYDRVNQEFTRNLSKKILIYKVKKQLRNEICQKKLAV